MMNESGSFQASVGCGVIDGQTVQELRTICATQQDFGELVEIYLNDLSDKMTLLAAAVSAHDFDVIRDISHTMISSSMSMGALQLGALFRAINVAAKKQSQSGVAEYFDTLPKNCAEVHRELLLAMNTQP
jgi:HPt (histidine-containing phosphotransfer) domain-containing protein